MAYRNSIRSSNPEVHLLISPFFSRKKKPNKQTKKTNKQMIARAISIIRVIIIRVKFTLNQSYVLSIWSPVTLRYRWIFSRVIFYTELNRRSYSTTEAHNILSSWNCALVLLFFSWITGIWNGRPRIVISSERPGVAVSLATTDWELFLAISDCQILGNHRAWINVGLC